MPRYARIQPLQSAAVCFSIADWYVSAKDNGAYYYYNPEAGKNYQQTMIDVKAYAESVGLPYQYTLLDSWW